MKQTEKEAIAAKLRTYVDSKERAKTPPPNPCVA